MFLTLTDITVGEQCHSGPNADGGEADPEFGKLTGGQQYLQIGAEIEVIDLDNRRTVKDWTMRQDPQIIEFEGYTRSAERSMDCHLSEEGHERWYPTIDLGEKIRGSQAFVIPSSPGDLYPRHFG